MCLLYWFSLHRWGKEVRRRAIFSEVLILCLVGSAQRKENPNAWFLASSWSLLPHEICYEGCSQGWKAWGWAVFSVGCGHPGQASLSGDEEVLVCEVLVGEHTVCLLPHASFSLLFLLPVWTGLRIRRVIRRKMVVEQKPKIQFTSSQIIVTLIGRLT